MAEVFGAVGTGISMLDLILKRIKTASRFKKDAEGAVADVTRLTRELELRTELLRDLYAEVKGLDFRGSSNALRSLENCESEIRQLRGILEQFESKLQDGRSWWTLLTTKMEFAWDKEDVNELHKNISSANETLADALRACQLYLQRASLEELRGIRTQDLPAIESSLQDVRLEDLPRIRRAISASISSEARNTRETVIESGWTTNTEIGNMRTSLQRMLASNMVDMQATLLPPIKQHMDGFTEIVVQELRQIRPEGSRSQSSNLTSAPSKSSSIRSCNAQGHMKTKRTTAIPWEGKLPVGIGSIILRHETRQRIFLRIRRHKGETDTSIDKETIWSLGFIPSAWLFGDTITGCNWKFSFRSSRRITAKHPVWGAIGVADIGALIGYLERGMLHINDVHETTGDSLLYHAVRFYSHDVCRWLVDNGIDAHAANDRLETPLFSLRRISPVGGHQQYIQNQGYSSLINLLLEDCGLDPHDINIHGESVLNSTNQVFTDHETFGSLVTLSMPLSTEPEEERLKHLFHSLADSHGTSKDLLPRLIWIVDEYKRRGLPQEDGDGRKWWYTSNFLRMLIALPHDRVVAKERVRMGQESLEWVREQVHEILRSGIDLHQRVGNETLLDFLQYPKRHPESFDNEAELFILTWFASLHQSGTVNLADYVIEELRLHPGGELREYSKHFYHEYHIFQVRVVEWPSNIEFTEGIVVQDPRPSQAMPGAWQTDIEGEYCEKWGLQLCYREVLDGPEDAKGWQDDWLIGFTENRSTAMQDDTVIDWMLQDRRRGKFYPLWTLSTAGFATGDYSLARARRYCRNFEQYPIWVEYPIGWVALRPHHLYLGRNYRDLLWWSQATNNGKPHAGQRQI